MGYRLVVLKQKLERYKFIRAIGRFVDVVRFGPTARPTVEKSINQFLNLCEE